MTHLSDKELDDYLRRESPVSARYRTLGADDVPPALDAAVMAQARAAVARPTKSRKQLPAWVRWGSPLALAASAVMIVAIVLEVGVQDELRVPAPQVKQPATTAQERETVKLDEAPALAPEPASVTPPQATAPPPAEFRQMLELKRERAKSEADARTQAPQLAARSVSGAAPMPAPTPERHEEVVVTGSNVRSVPEDAALPVDVIAEETPLKSNDQTRPPFGPRAPGAPRAVSAATRADAAESRQQYATPESWLDAIRKLRVDGKTGEADEEWRAFRLAYPDFEVRAGDAALPRPQR